jgi:hypothetical protein
MALENGRSPAGLETSNKEAVFADKVDTGSGSDPEKGSRRGSKIGSFHKAAGGRIAPVLPHLSGYDVGSDDAGSDILGKQIELEAGNDIQYRTCTWQKVCSQYDCGVAGSLLAPPSHGDEH